MTVFSFLGYIVVLFGLAFLLIKAANLAVSALHSIIKHLKLSTFGLAAFLVALSTSLPELIVSITASLEGDGELALGNVLGSNIANISLILGGASVIAGLLRSNDALIKKQVFTTFLIGSLPMLLLIDGRLSRLEGVGLILLYFVYIGGQMRKKLPLPTQGEEEERPWRNMLIKIGNKRLSKNIGVFIVGIAGMIFAADFMVKVSHTFAASVGIPEFLIGLFIISIGTSLPELAFEIAAIKNHQATMAYANIMGSVVINATLVLGIAAVIRPIVLAASLKPYLISNLCFLIVFAIFWRFVWTKHRLDRWEGAMLVLIYIAFALIQYVSNINPLTAALP